MATENIIDNNIYNRLGERWYTASDDPVALLRAESRLRNPWLLKKIDSAFPGKRVDVLDLGCGGGFLSNFLADHHNVTGFDISEESLRIAAQYDKNKRVRYIQGDAVNTGLPNEGFDVVCCMDMLEHVRNYADVVREASRVLKPGGLFVFYTFNRNLISNLVAIKVVEWFVPNTPKNMHVYDMFITPQELNNVCQKNNLQVKELIGLRPKMRSVMRALATNQISDDFSFCFTPSLKISYLGVSNKIG